MKTPEIFLKNFGNYLKDLKKINRNYANSIENYEKSEKIFGNFRIVLGNLEQFGKIF